MDSISDIFLAVLPALVVFFTAYFLLQKFLVNEQKKNYFNLKSESQKTTIPIRLQAYERVALYLERINISNLIFRVYKNGMSGRMLQSELLKTIRTEYDHNVAQQIYISTTGWQAIRQAKEETIKIINIAASRVSDDATGNDLSRAVLEVSSQIERVPSDYALELIKKEIKSIF